MWPFCLEIKVKREFRIIFPEAGIKMPKLKRNKFQESKSLVLVVSGPLSIQDQILSEFPGHIKDWKALKIQSKKCKPYPPSFYLLLILKTHHSYTILECIYSWNKSILYLIWWSKLKCTRWRTTELYFQFL